MRAGRPSRTVPASRGNRTGEGATVATTASLADLAQQELAGFHGELIGPGHTGYDEARAVYNAMIDRRPGLIARCASADDAAAAIHFARRHAVLVAVRGGGHNSGRPGTVHGSVAVH